MENGDGLMAFHPSSTLPIPPLPQRPPFSNRAKTARPLMPRFVMPRPRLIPRQTLVIPLVRPLPDGAEVATGMFAVAV